MKDKDVLYYQETGDSSRLVKKYENFLSKYLSMIQYRNIDFRNYDVRYFLSCYISDEKISKSLRKGKYHSTEAIAHAYEVAKKLQHKLKGYTEEEIKHELIIPFLQCAKSYKQVGVGFDTYLYKTYKYVLKRHLDGIRWDALNHSNTVYRDVTIEADWDIEYNEDFFLDLNNDFELNDPRWIHQEKAQAPFSEMKPHERYILVKYYYEEYTDREIARMLPYNPKSIHRIRMRLTKYLQDLYNKGDIKCLRI